MRGAAVEGYRLEVHAIGDAAAEAVLLDAFEAELGPPPPAAAATAGAAAAMPSLTPTPTLVPAPLVPAPTPARMSACR